MSVNKFASTLPDKIKVNAHWWGIKKNVDPSIIDQDGKLIWGLTDYQNLEIKLRKDAPTKEFLVGTFLHEIYHAGIASFGINVPKREEEQALFQETLWLSVYSSNPWLLDWIKRGLK